MRKNNMCQFMQEHDMIASNLGPTFMKSNCQDSTSIGFFLHQKNNDNILQVEKMDVIANVSDHYPIKITILHNLQKMENIKKHRNDNRKSIRWDKVDKELYKTNVTDRLQQLEIDNPCDSSETFKALNEILIQSAEAAGPTRKNGSRRPKLKVMNDAI